MKKVFSMVIAIIIIAGVVPGATLTAGAKSSKFISGIDPPAKGSKAISTRAQLEMVRNDGVYHLTADIDLSGKEWEPLGLNNPFTGVFDGQGHVIRNLTINKPHTPTGSDYRYAGLFARTDEQAVIKNVGLENSKIKIGESGTLDERIDYTKRYSAYAGGICAYFSGTVTNCYNTGSISSHAHNSSYAGGICGMIVNTDKSSVYNCYNTGSISSEAESCNTGGISGIINGNINNCYNKGKITSLSYSTSSYTGGICGDTSKITNCYNNGDISANNGSAGGISGSVYTISGCYNTGNVSGTTLVGGICGFYDGEYDSLLGRGYIRDCYNKGNVSASTAASINNATAGGIFGKSDSFSEINISCCYNMGNVTASSQYSSYAGGICGYCRLIDADFNRKGVLQQCYNTGNISGNGKSGSVFAGAIAGEMIVVKNNNPIGCYWYLSSKQTVNGKNLSNPQKVGVGSGTDNTDYLTSSKMKKASSYKDFDFKYIWGISSKVNNGYPYLLPEKYSLSISPSGNKDFGSVKAGYTSPPVYTVKVTNNGNRTNSDYNVTLSGNNANDFSLSGETRLNLEAGKTASFTVKPRYSLSPGTYTAKVTITGTGEKSIKSFDVKFKVTK